MCCVISDGKFGGLEREYSRYCLEGDTVLHISKILAESFQLTVSLGLSFGRSRVSSKFRRISRYPLRFFFLPSFLHRWELDI